MKIPETVEYAHKKGMMKDALPRTCPTVPCAMLMEIANVVAFVSLKFADNQTDNNGEHINENIVPNESIAYRALNAVGGRAPQIVASSTTLESEEIKTYLVL